MSENEQISLIIKTTVDTKTYELKISKNLSIKDLKNEIEKLTNIPSGAQKIIHKGRNLKDTETIESSKIENNDSIVVIRNRNYNPNGPRNTNIIGAFPQVSPLMIQNLLNNNFMNLGRIPQLHRQNPNLNRLNFIRQSINDPVARAFLGRIPSNMMVHDSIVGTTVPDLENKFTEFMQNRNNNNNNNNTNNNESNNNESNNNENNNLNNNNNPNPEQFNPQNFINFLNMLRPNQPPPNFNIRISRPLQTNNNNNNNNNNNEQNSQNQNENIDYKEIYKEQLAQLKDMGFTDENKNIEILKQCQGNVNFAIEKLFGGVT
jgi:hypothetical protein